MMISHRVPGTPVIQSADSRTEKAVKTANPRLYIFTPAKYVADPPETHHEHGRDQHVAHQQLQEVAGVGGG